MNLPTFSLRTAIFALLAIALLIVFTTPLLAADTTGVLPADFLSDIAGNRSKIIQLSIVFVIVGIALLFKK